jgi:adenine deaminase
VCEDYPRKDSYDAKHSYATPGLIDSHIHIESTMLHPAEFARYAVATGTTQVHWDPHEIANVAGRQGIAWAFSCTEKLPLDVYISLSSCVPATPLETSGAQLELDDLAIFFNHTRCAALAEMMNFPGVLSGDEGLLAKMHSATEQCLPLDGHCPQLRGKDLQGYIAAGIGSDHESVAADEAWEKVSSGLHIFLREGSAAQNLKALAGIAGRVPHRCSLCSDDRSPSDLLIHGHMDHILRLAVSYGLDPIQCLQMATLNAARYFGMRDVGAIAPGYVANIALFDSLENLAALAVFHRGVLVAEDRRYIGPPMASAEPVALHSVKLPPLSAASFEMPVQGSQANVIGLIRRQIVTRHLVEAVRETNGRFVSDTSNDILKLAVVERHGRGGSIGLGLVKGFGLQSGAIASTIAHDSHNLIIVGVTDTDMLAAAQHIAEIGGGCCVVNRGQVLAALPLPLGGLMSQDAAPDVARLHEDVEKAAASIGCRADSPLMALSFLALAPIPALKLTDLGLVDVQRFQQAPVFF